MNNRKIKYSLLCLLAALIWGFAFSFQSLASSIGPITFCACRGVLATVAIATVTYFTSKNLHIDKKTAKGGAISGFFLAMGSFTQQAGIAYTSPGKAAFITTLYLVLVALAAVVIKRKMEKRILLAVILATIGLYFICMKPGESFRSITKGDLLLLLCSLMFAAQIMSTDHYINGCDPIKFSLMAFITYLTISTVMAFILEKPDIREIKSVLPSVLYCGIMSSAVGYTLQMIGQKHLQPVLATICLSFESVFSVLGEWLMFGTIVTKREGLGCAIMFIAIMIAQISPGEIKTLRRKNRKKTTENE